jgi:hypothetical protein
MSDTTWNSTSRAKLHGIIEQAEEGLPNSKISRGSRVEAVIRAACRRRLFVLAVEQLAFALAVIFGGAVLMLLLGTQILHWYWLALLAVPCVALACVRMRGRTLPPYRVAQIVDRRLQLSDSLSTAWFLLSTAKAQDDPVARFQIGRAEVVACTVKPARAFPLAGRRTWALTGAMGAVLFGLFAVRYLVTHSLNLERALVPIHLDAAFAAFESPLLAENRRVQTAALDAQRAKWERTGARNKHGSGGVLPGQDMAGQQDEISGGQSQPGSSDSQPNHTHAGPSQSRSTSAPAAQESLQDTAEHAPGDETSSEQAQNNNEQTAAQQQGSPGLLDKMKDALSSLMAKMRPNQSVDNRPQNSERMSEGQKDREKTNAATGQQGTLQQDASNEQSPQNQSSQTQAQRQATERAQASQGRDADQLPEKGSDAHSGIGRQDGNKDLKEAEQLQAMGKLAEIIGKRSASVTGEIMVDTPSGKQQLKTAYSQRVGHHADLGGEINRDEIPLADQQYIREYMELVRKQDKSDR